MSGLDVHLRVSELALQGFVGFELGFGLVVGYERFPSELDARGVDDLGRVEGGAGGFLRSEE